MHSLKGIDQKLEFEMVKRDEPVERLQSNIDIPLYLYYPC